VRLIEEALERFDLELEQWTFEDIAAPVDADVAARLGQVVRLVILQAIGVDDGVAPAQLRLALDHGLQVGTAEHVLARKIRGQLVAHGLRNVFAQLRAGLEHQRLWLLRPGGCPLQQCARQERRRGQGKAGAKRLGCQVVHQGQWGPGGGGAPGRQDWICRMDYP